MEKSDSLALTEPADEAKERSLQLSRYIREACEREGGAIRFSEFMNIALYQPGLGYYTGGLQKFGAKGDYITAPEVSALFGQCLANQVEEIVQNFRRCADETVNIIEFGAGSGVLALDVLHQLEKLDSLPENYFILELSAELKHRQKQTIRQKAPHLYDHVQWLEKLPSELTNAVIIANEVLDAMPVECFRVSGSPDTRTVETLMVSAKGEGLFAQYRHADDAVAEKIGSIEQRSDISFAGGYCSEFNPAVEGWLSALASRAERAVILLIDYGYNEAEYYHPDRASGTLMCYYQHKAHEDYLWWPGLQDITAFVNFTDVAYSALGCSLEVAGYTTQAAFLLANGLSDLHAAQVTNDVRQQVKLSQQIKTLTLPSEMGDRFKVMALTKNYDEPLQGFSMLDLRNRL